MFKKSVKYVDFDGNEVTEELYFNLNVVEQTKFEAKYIGGSIETLEQYLNKLLKEQIPKNIIDFICDLIESSYGVKNSDNKTFTKNKKIREDFENSLAYAELFEEILMDPVKLEAFVKGILSKNKLKEVASANEVQ